MTTEYDEMPVFAATEPADDVPVGMGLAVLAGAPTRLMAVVGSCIGVAVYCPQLRLGMLSHVVLPRANGRTAYPAKYADTAVSEMCSVLKSRGAGSLVARIAGGACMFGDGVFTRIGEANVRAALAALEAAGIRIAGCDVGGAAGRRIWFDLTTGCVTVESIGCGRRIL